MLAKLRLYYIVSLHQTTTVVVQVWPLVLLYYIVSLHQTTTHHYQHHNSVPLYYIVSLHQTTTGIADMLMDHGCIISFLYIKPQPSGGNVSLFRVVLYRFSTSNHNHQMRSSARALVVLYRFSTSNHNLPTVSLLAIGLYYIVSLHQTTTLSKIVDYIIRCIISFLYIKPQPSAMPRLSGYVVLYRFSTSNHNLMCIYSLVPAVVLYRFSTSNHNYYHRISLGFLVVLYRFSTSNHNLYHLHY